MEHEEALDALIDDPGVVMLVGAIDTGKTTFAIELAKRAMNSGVPVAIVDADTVQSHVGPPTTAGMKLCTGEDSLTRQGLSEADALGFVGSLVPKGHLLPLVTSTAKLVKKAQKAGARMIIIDTTSLVSGIYGQALKYHKIDMIHPDKIVAFERGGEMEPIVGLAQRFSPSVVLELPVDPQVVPRTVEDRMTFREEQFAAYFANGVHRWKVKPTVFMPVLPPEFDLALLDDLVVGMEDGQGWCIGIGILEYDSDEDILKMVTPITEGVKGLRIGSVRMETSGRSKGPVDLRHLFGSE